MGKAINPMGIGAIPIGNAMIPLGNLSVSAGKRRVFREKKQKAMETTGADRPRHAAADAKAANLG